MTRINLLPPEIKEKVERPHLMPWIILMGLITVVIIAGLYFLFHAQKAGKEDTLKQKQAELEELKKQTKPMERFEAQQKELKSLQSLYQQANVGRVAWAKMLNDLAMYVPEGLATASNPRAPTIWLTNLTIDAQPLEAIGGKPTAGRQAGQATPIVIKGYATPAWLCIQTWLPRASDFKAKGFLDAYPYYYYFRGHPKVAEFFVRLQNMEEWSNLWITDSAQTTISETRLVTTTDAQGVTQVQEESYSDWAIQFTITGQWNPEKAIWQAESASGTTGG
ncbi:MAG: PilN domain-containing protein [Actinomycetota bacterium]